MTAALSWYELRYRSRWSPAPSLPDLAGQGEGIARKALLRSPVPTVLVNKKGRILVASKSFSALFSGIQRGRKLPEILAPLLDSEEELSIEINDTKYRAIRKEYDTFSGPVRALYLMDEHEVWCMQQALQEQAPVLGLLQVDNYEEVLAEHGIATSVAESGYRQASYRLG